MRTGDNFESAGVFDSTQQLYAPPQEPEFGCQPTQFVKTVAVTDDDQPQGQSSLVALQDATNKVLNTTMSLDKSKIDDSQLAIVSCDGADCGRVVDSGRISHHLELAFRYAGILEPLR
jgi:hypothetical protein